MNLYISYNTIYFRLMNIQSSDDELDDETWVAKKKKFWISPIKIKGTNRTSKTFRKAIS